MRLGQLYARLRLLQLLIKLYWMLKIKLVSNLKLRKYWKPQLMEKIRTKAKASNGLMKRKKNPLILKKSWATCKSPSIWSPKSKS